MFFAECRALALGKEPSLPSASLAALDKDSAEFSSARSVALGKEGSLPSAADLALSKALEEIKKQN
jgi:hypothetical protein